MPHVIHVISTPSGIGGAELVVGALVAAGTKQGWEQTVLNPFAADPADLALAEVCSGARYSAAPCASPRDLPAVARWLRAELLSSEPDLVHSHLFHAGALVATVRPRRLPTVLTHHHGDHLVTEGRRAAEIIDRIALRRYDRVVAISDWVARFLQTRYRCPAERLVTIPNGWVNAATTGRSLRTGQESAVILCIANFRAQKGHRELIRAFGEVRAEIPHARLLLVGSGPLEAETRAMVDGAGLTGCVEFVGRTNDVAHYLASADVFALASRYEPQGIAVIEAMASRLPVVATAVGGIVETIAEGETGFLVRPGDVEGLARALIRLLRSPEERARVGTAAREWARGRSMDATADRYLGLYTDLLEGRR